MQFYLVRITFLVLGGFYSDVYSKLVQNNCLPVCFDIWNLQYVGTVGLRPYSDPVWYICLHQYIGTVWFTEVRWYCLCSSERRFFFFLGLIFSKQVHGVILCYVKIGRSRICCLPHKTEEPYWINGLTDYQINGIVLRVVGVLQLFGLISRYCELFSRSRPPEERLYSSKWNSNL